MTQPQPAPSYSPNGQRSSARRPPATLPASSQVTLVDAAVASTSARFEAMAPHQAKSQASQTPMIEVIEIEDDGPPPLASARIKPSRFQRPRQPTVELAQRPMVNQVAPQVRTITQLQAPLPRVLRPRKFPAKHAPERPMVSREAIEAPSSAPNQVITVGVSPASLEQGAQKVTRKAPSGARRPQPKAAIAVREAPYRNTRSRSHSVEPSAFLSANVNTNPRGVLARKARKKPVMELVEEAEEIAQNTPGPVILDLSGEEEMIDADIPRDEAEEEQDVEDLLITNESAMSRVESAAEVDELADEPDSDGELDNESMDADDQQIDESLRQQARQQSQTFRFPSSSSLFALSTDPAEVLKRFNGKASEEGQARASSTRSPFAARNIGLQQPRDSDRFPLQMRTPFTTISRPGLSTPRSRGASDSSTEFPISGTRASAMKKRLEEQERHSPYRPPAGTRASQLALSQR